MQQQLNHIDEKQRKLFRSLGAYAGFLVMLLYVWMTFSTLATFVVAATLVIWGTSLVAYKKLPTIRRETLKNNRWFTFGYIGGLILFQLVIRFFWGVAPSDVLNGMDPNVVRAPETFGMSVVNMLGTVFLLTTISVPGSYLLMTFKNLRHSQVVHEDRILKRYRKF